MKGLLGVFALVGVGALIATSSCGPSKPFCPTNLPDFSCFDTDGNVIAGTGGQSGGLCDGGSVILCGDPAQTKVCKQDDCPPP